MKHNWRNSGGNPSQADELMMFGYFVCGAEKTQSAIFRAEVTKNVAKIYLEDYLLFKNKTNIKLFNNLTYYARVISKI